MKSLWNTEEATKYKKCDLELRAYTSRLLGQNDDLVLHGGGNTSVKITQQNIFGELEDRLYVKGSGHDLKTIQKNGFASTRLDYLKKLAMLPCLSDSEMMKELKSAQTNPSHPTPSVEAILHAIIPHKFVDHTHADAVVAISNAKNGPQMISSIYPQRVLILPYTMPGFILSRQILERTADINWDLYDAIILLHHGVFTFSDDAQKSYENMIDICHRAEVFLQQKNAWQTANAQPATPPDLLHLSKLRKTVSQHAGKNMLASFKQTPEHVGYASLEKIEKAATRGPITPDHVLHTKRIPMIITGESKQNVASYTDEYRQYFEKNKTTGLQCLDPAPRFAIWPKQGVMHFAPNPKRLKVIEDIIAHTIKAVQWGEQLGGWQALDEKNIFDLEYWELEQAKLKKSDAVNMFEGKICLVTGAASGIGRATCLEVMAHGAACIGLDINPDVSDIHRSENYLGIVCDITNPQSVKAALEATILRFGGLDILISNAGNFPKSAMIESMEDEMWNKSLELNLSSHMRLIKSAIPFLRLGIDPCVVIVGSKNVAAPGPGAASYSVAKAGLTQLARVAAMELGLDGIRVNVVHPNAVFDTGIWDSETLSKRAAAYGMSVTDYKKNNILGTTITSEDVARLIGILAGPGFKTVTGAQIPIDGGNDRVL